MPSVKRRLALTLDDDLAQALDDFAAASGTSKASFVTNILRDSLPILQGLTKAYEIAKKQPVKAIEMINNELLTAQVKAAQASLDLNDSALRKVRPRKRNK